jgi:hypothetical protein
MDYSSDFAQTDICELNHQLTNDLVGALKPKQSNFGRPIEEMQELLKKVCA